MKSASWLDNLVKQATRVSPNLPKIPQLQPPALRGTLPAAQPLVPPGPNAGNATQQQPASGLQLLPNVSQPNSPQARLFGGAHDQATSVAATMKKQANPFLMRGQPFPQMAPNYNPHLAAQMQMQANLAAIEWQRRQAEIASMMQHAGTGYGMYPAPWQVQATFNAGGARKKQEPVPHEAMLRRNHDRLEERIAGLQAAMETAQPFQKHLYQQQLNQAQVAAKQMQAQLGVIDARRQKAQQAIADNMQLQQAKQQGAVQAGGPPAADRELLDRFSGVEPYFDELNKVHSVKDGDIFGTTMASLKTTDPNKYDLLGRAMIDYANGANARSQAAGVNSRVELPTEDTVNKMLVGDFVGSLPAAARETALRSVLPDDFVGKAGLDFTNVGETRNSYVKYLQSRPTPVTDPHNNPTFRSWLAGTGSTDPKESALLQEKAKKMLQVMDWEAQHGSRHDFRNNFNQRYPGMQAAGSKTPEAFPLLDPASAAKGDPSNMWAAFAGDPRTNPGAAKAPPQAAVGPVSVSKPAFGTTSTPPPAVAATPKSPPVADIDHAAPGKLPDTRDAPAVATPKPRSSGSRVEARDASPV